MSRILLVEGATDQAFLRTLLRRASPDLATQVDIHPPRVFRLQNTATVIPKLLTTLIPQLENGQIAALGVMADADHVSGGGFQARWQQYTRPLADVGYRIPKTPPKRAWHGSVFRHPDGLPAVGLWLMPDHHQNGMLEDWLLASISQAPEQQTLLEHARGTVAALPTRLFSEYHQSKAVVYTWLAWQKRPGLGMAMAADAALLDGESQPVMGLLTWLRSVFAN